MKVTLEKVNSAIIKVNNSKDESKVYDMSANLSVNGANVTSVNDGVVMKGEERKANFYRYSEENLNIQFLTADVMEMCAIINAVNGFIGDCVAAVANNEFNIG